MKYLFYTVMLLPLVLTCGDDGSAAVPEVGSPGLAYTLINGDTEFSVSKGTFTAGKLVIPSTWSNLPVTAIGFEGFAELPGLTGITIGTNIREIVDSAFWRCTGLTTVTIPDHIVRLEDAFSECTNLVSVTLGAGITNIGQGAFVKCGKLTSVRIPDGVQSIGNNAFSRCFSLANLQIGSGVTLIDQFAFHRTSLTNLVIPANVQQIKWWAFTSCSNLASVSIGNGLQYLGYQAFQNCAVLKTVVVDATTPPATTTGEMFQNCHADLSILVPTAVVDTYKAAAGWSAYSTRISAQ